MARTLSSRKPLMAKAVQMVYGFPGNLLEGWEAKPIGDHQYEILRSNKTTRIVNAGEQIKIREPGSKEPTSVIINETGAGVLMVGNMSVLIGSGIKHGFQARQLAKSAGRSSAPASYLLMSDTNRQIGRVTIGQAFEGKPVSLVDGHLLQVGEDIFPITPKMHDITLLVMASPYEGGYLSYINVVESGNGLNRRDGAMGSLIPPRNKGEPALFQEVYGGKLVVTARFWVENNGTKLSYQYRDGSMALEEVRAQEEMFAARKIAVEAGIEPEDLAEYCEAKEKLGFIEMQWQKEGMALIQGARCFEPHDFKEELESRGVSYSM